MMGICSYIAPKSLYFGSKFSVMKLKIKSVGMQIVTMNMSNVTMNLLIVTMNNDVCNDGTSTVTFIFTIILIYCYK